MDSFSGAGFAVSVVTAGLGFASLEGIPGAAFSFETDSGALLGFVFSSTMRGFLAVSVSAALLRVLFVAPMSTEKNGGIFVCWLGTEEQYFCAVQQPKTAAKQIAAFSDSSTLSRGSSHDRNQLSFLSRSSPTQPIRSIFASFRWLGLFGSHPMMNVTLTNKAGGTVTVNGGAKLALNGDLTNEGDFDVSGTVDLNGASQEQPVISSTYFFKSKDGSIT